MQEAYASALQAWAAGIPDNPAAWLTTAARRRAIDAIRRDKTLRSRLPPDARRATRVGADGRLVLLKDQERSAWDRAALAEADAMIVGCLRAGPPGRYVLQAAIASLYAQAPSYDQTDWPQILAVYDKLLEVWPSPVVALNRAVPLAMVSGPRTALAEVARLEGDSRLSGYHYLTAIKADLLSRLGRTREAADAYRQALALAANDAERAFLEEQISEHMSRLAVDSIVDDA